VLASFTLLLALLVAPLPGAPVASPAGSGPQPRAGGAGSFLTVEEALELAFPGCEVERQTAYLDRAQARAVERLARSELASRVVRPYVARREGRLVGTAYFDAHRVRSKNEVLMLVVAPDGSLARVEVLAFAEPPEYLPRGAFYAQFAGRVLDDRLELDRGLRGVAGATLSARAATAAARRTLALHRVLRDGVPPGDENADDAAEPGGERGAGS